MNKLLVSAFISLFSASCALAQAKDGDWIQYTIHIDKTEVTGAFLVARIIDKETVRQGYSLKQVAHFLREDCASGKIGKIELGEQKKKRRRGKKFIFQRFTSTCSGGIIEQFRGSKHSTIVTVSKQEDGRDLANYFFGRHGDLINADVYR